MNNIRFEDWEAEQLQDPVVREIAEDLEPGYQVARLRIKLGLSQAELAALASTHQSSIARLESGKVTPRLSFLRKVVNALGGRLEIKITPHEEIVATNNFFVKDFPQAKSYESFNDNTRTADNLLRVE